MVRCMESLLYEQQLEKLGLLNLPKLRLKGGIIAKMHIRGTQCRILLCKIKKMEAHRRMSELNCA